MTSEPGTESPAPEGLADGFWRDASGRLTFGWPCPEAADFPVLCRGVVDALGLEPAGKLVIGPEQMFRDFRRGEHVVGLDWDIWMEFMAVAKSPAAESLVQEIAAWLTRPTAAGATGAPGDGESERG